MPKLLGFFPKYSYSWAYCIFQMMFRSEVWAICGLTFPWQFSLEGNDPIPNGNSRVWNSPFSRIVLFISSSILVSLQRGKVWSSRWKKVCKKLDLVDVFYTALQLTVHQYGTQIWLSYQKLSLRILNQRQSKTWRALNLD